MGIIKATRADGELYSRVQDYAYSGMKGKKHYLDKFLGDKFLDFEGIQRDIIEDVQIAADRAKYAIDMLTTNWDAKPQKREDVLREHYGVVSN